MKKRVWSILLALCMALALLPVGALADGETLQEGNFTYTVTDGKAIVTGYVTEPEGALEIPETLGGYPVTEIGVDAFYECAKLTEVTFPESVKRIADGAFAESSLQKAVLPEGLDSLGSGAFYGCIYLTDIALPASLQTLGAGALSCCAMESIRVPDAIKNLPDECFSGCLNLKEIQLPADVKSFGWMCFADCNSLESFEIPDSVTKVSAEAFAFCASLRSVTIGSGIREIPVGMFHGCQALEEIDIPETITKIEDEAFQDCVSLKYAVIPDSVTFLGGQVFNGCKKLEFCVISSGMTAVYGDTFRDCKSLKQVFIPDSVTQLGEDLFAGCTALEYVRIPQKVTTLPTGLFSGCKSLQVIAMPAAVQEIDQNVFQGCTALEAIEYNGTEAQLRKISMVENGNSVLQNVTVYLISGYPDVWYGFLDLPAETNWAYEGIAFCLDNGFMNGVGGGRFDPYGVTTRAQLVTILWRMSGEPKPTKKLPFTDCGISWADDAIAWAAENGIVNGTSAKTFSPGDPCTREQLVTIFHRYCREYLGMDVSQTQSLKKFPDAKKVSSWAKDAMEWGTAVKLINGVGTPRGDELQPQGSADRAQIARVIMNFCVNVAPTADGE